MTTTPSRSYHHAFQVFGLSENPFQGSPDPRFFYSGDVYRSTLSELCSGIEAHRGLLVLTGEPGTGKTLLVRQLLQWLAGKGLSSSYVFHSHLNSSGLFEFILSDFAIKTESTRKSELLAALQRFLQARQAEGDSPVIVIDEAQALSTRALSELCLLLNLENTSGKLLQIVLVGQTELEEKLRRPELRQLRQRVSVRCRLPLLGLQETEDYIAARLRCAGATDQNLFPPETLQALYSYAQGIPRVVNLLCEKALLAAYAENLSVVTLACMRRAAAGFDFGFETRSADLPPIPVETTILLPLRPPTPLPLALEHPPIPLAAHAVVESVLDMPPVPSDVRPKPNVTVLSPKSVELPPPHFASEQPAFSQPVAETHSIPAEQTVPPPRVQFRRRPDGAFARYWSDVAGSFVRDFRHLIGAFQTQAAADGKVLFMKKYDLKRDLVAPVSRWLAKPVAFNGRKPH